MFKLGFLLFLIAGLAIGLWIGFDPHMHRQALQATRETRVTLTEMRPNLVEMFNGAALRLQSGVHLSWNSSPSASQQVKFSWKQVDQTFTLLWEKVKDFFVRLSAQASL